MTYYKVVFIYQIINVLNDESPYPETFDPTRTRQEVLDTIKSFLDDC